MYNCLDTIPACDGQTDGRTDILRRHSPRYANASRGKNATLKGVWEKDVRTLQTTSAFRRSLYTAYTECLRLKATTRLLTLADSVRRVLHCLWRAPSIATLLDRPCFPGRLTVVAGSGHRIPESGLGSTQIGRSADIPSRVYDIPLDIPLGYFPARTMSSPPRISPRMLKLEYP